MEVPVQWPRPTRSAQTISSNLTIADSFSPLRPIDDTRAAAMDEGTPNQQSHASSTLGQDMPPRADIDEILRRKRKAREYKVRSAPFCCRNVGIRLFKKSRPEWEQLRRLSVPSYGMGTPPDEVMPELTRAERGVNVTRNGCSRL